MEGDDAGARTCSPRENVTYFENFGVAFGCVFVQKVVSGGIWYNVDVGSQKVNFPRLHSGALSFCCSFNLQVPERRSYSLEPLTIANA